MGLPFLGQLHRRGCHMRLPRKFQLLRGGAGVDAAASAVKGNMVVVIDHHRLGIDIGDIDIVDIVDRSVVSEVIVVPVAASVPVSDIADP